MFQDKRCDTFCAGYVYYGREGEDRLGMCFEVKKADLMERYTIIKGVKKKEDKELTKQTLILNILYSEAGSVKYGRWYKKHINPEPFGTRGDYPKYKWNISNKWRSITIDLGKTKGGNKGKAFISRSDHKDSYQYTILYSIYADDKKKWLSYSEHTIKYKKPNDTKIIERAIASNPMVK